MNNKKSASPILRVLGVILGITSILAGFLNIFLNPSGVQDFLYIATCLIVGLYFLLYGLTGYETIYRYFKNSSKNYDI